MKRILTVDDAATIRLYLRSVLEEHGFVVDEAVNGLEALERALVGQYDLYLVDLNMPKLDGFSFVRELRSNPDIRQVPVIVVSTESSKNSFNKGLEVGVNRVLVKPIRPDVLIANVRLLTGEVK